MKLFLGLSTSIVAFVSTVTFADPQTTDPQTTDPQTTDPQTTDPQTTDPQTTPREAESPSNDNIRVPVRSDEASGIAVPRQTETHDTVNAFLSVPRFLVVGLLHGPRLVASEIDDHLESSSATSRPRDGPRLGWRFGLSLEWEASLGPNFAARTGHYFDEHVGLDISGGLFGSRGKSGEARIHFGRHSALAVKPILTVWAGKDLERRFAGVGETESEPSADPIAPYSAGPRTDYEETRYAAALDTRASRGPFSATIRAAYDQTTPVDAGTTPLGSVYSTEELRGFEERQRAGAAQFSLTFDNREPAHKWIPLAAPSNGSFVKATVGYENGDGARTGSFSSTRLVLTGETRFDLFRGDRVLIIHGHYEALGAERTKMPFNRLAMLGGRARMRALDRGQLRDRISRFASLSYEWAVGRTNRAYLFSEAGAVDSNFGDAASRPEHFGFGGGFRIVGGKSTSVRLQLGLSNEGDLGFFVRLGAL